jgi:hypothetical protein
MFKKLNLRKIVAVATCLAVTTMFFSCDPKEKEDEGTGPGTEQKSNQKQITAFDFTSLPAYGVISEANKTVTFNVPFGTSVTKLTPTIKVSDKATVSPASGIEQDFTNTLTYTVTAENQTTVDYKVTVTVEPPVGDPTPLPATISQNTTLKDLGLPIDYFFDGTSALEVRNNATLTIEPGVTIQFRKAGGYLSITDGASISAIGEADKRIQFVGINNEKGAWRGIQIGTVLSNELKYVDILNAGSQTANQSAALYLSRGKADINYCIIDRSHANGITIESSSGNYNIGELRSFMGNTVSNCDKAPIYTYSYTSCGALKNIENNNSFTDNANAYIHISQSMNTRILNDMTLRSLGGYPWYFQAGLSIDNDIKFTVEAGAVILIGTNTGISIPATSHFIALGTHEKRITIKGFRDEAGYWTGIVSNSKTPGTKFDYCDISGGGRNLYSALIRYGGVGYIEIYNSHLSKSLNNGVRCDYSSAKFNIHYNCFLKHNNVTFSEITGAIFYINEPSPSQSFNALPAMSGDSWWQFF